MTSSAAPSYSPPAARGRCVLVVEDNDTTRDRLTHLLRTHGYEVVEAIDGLDALRKASARQIDAILLDLVLPHVDGWQFRATQLRHPELAAIPTIIVTVQPLREPDRYALRTPDVIHKPFEDPQVLEAVERACLTAQPAHAPIQAEVGGLFWSRRGEIACAVHAPDGESRRWSDERWTAIPAGAGNNRIVYQCQHCAGDRSPIRRGRRAPGREGS
jgi:CheY-like chemotaxis protein